jgi:deazaflavin-dependent oxidoreductase (nitroreductase family)
VPDVNDWNAKVISEFREHDGKVGGQFQGATLLLLHSTGAKSGKERINPLAYLADGDRFVIFGSKAGAPTHPDWYYNVVAHPEVTIEVGTKTVGAKARVAEGDERQRLWDRQKQVMPGFADYETKTERTIPVIVLEPAV